MHVLQAALALSAISGAVTIGALVTMLWATRRHEPLRLAKGGDPRGATRTRMVVLVGCIACQTIFLAIGVHMVATVFAPETAYSERGRDHCDPLVLDSCMLPFPSSFYLVPDRASHTGLRVNLSATSFPRTRWGNVDPERWNENDGFSTASPVVFGFGTEVATADLVAWSNISTFADPTATTLLLEMDTAERVAHFVDRDSLDRGFGPAGRSDLLVLQPAAGLRFNSTYVVAVRRLYTVNGTVISPSPAFKAMRDGVSHPLVSAARQQHFEEVVFPTLKRAGVNRKDLILAFDYHTVSRAESLGRFEHMRRVADKQVMKNPSENLKYTIERIVETPDACLPSTANTSNMIARTIWGSFSSPNFMNKPGPGPQRYLTRESAPPTQGGIRSMPYQNGLGLSQFLVRIPCSLSQPGSRARLVLQYGHGLFGSRDEALTDYLSHMAHNNSWIVVATDWHGMSQNDVLNAMRVFLGKASEFATVPERTMQGWVDNHCFLTLVRGALARDPAMFMGDTPLVGADTPLRYYGNSQGSVIGGGYFASSTQLSQAVLGVPGCPFALLLSRSKDFDEFDAILRLQLWSRRDLRIFITVIQQLWDPAETSGWLSNVQPYQMGEYPAKHVLLQAGIGDGQVSTIAGQFMARSMNCSTVTPQTRPVFGVEERPANFSGEFVNAYVEWKFDDVPPIPFTNTPPKSDTHECPRRMLAGQKQIALFFEKGIIVQTCNGTCHNATCSRNPYKPNGTNTSYGSSAP